jgi:undecaprenyl-diphosphatase
MLLILFIQIIAEALPVSSSGHLFLFEKLFFNRLLWSEFLDHLAHGPTLIVLAVFFWPDISPMIRAAFSFRRKVIFLIAKLISFVFVADLITAIFYLVIKTYVGTAPDIVVSFGFFATGISLFSLLFIPDRERFQPLTFKKSLLLGVAQGLALLPGISRFAFTYVVARWLKMSNRRAFQVSFLIQFPLIVAAFSRALISLPNNLEKTPLKIPFCSWPALLVVMLAMVVAYFLLGLMRRLTLKNMLWPFGIYVFFVGLSLFLM